MSFRDRAEAGRRLGAALADLARSRPLKAPVVVALPRGGVPVGHEIARALNAPLEVLIVRKIGAPGHPEYGLGAVVDGTPPQVVLTPPVMETIRPDRGYLEAETRRQMEELERRRRVYRRHRPPLDVRGRTVVLVDDGIATGGTVRAALRGLMQAAPSRLILAVPVAPADVIASFRLEADDVICLETPDPFVAVGLHYDDFRQTKDDEVIALLDADRFRDRTQ